MSATVPECPERAHRHQRRAKNAEDMDEQQAAALMVHALPHVTEVVFDITNCLVRWYSAFPRASVIHNFIIIILFILIFFTLIHFNFIIIILFTQRGASANGRRHASNCTRPSYFISHPAPDKQLICFILRECVYWTKFAGVVRCRV